MMGLFRRTSSPAATEARGVFPSTSFAQVAAMVASGQFGTGPVTEDQALRSAAAWSCIDVLATTMSTLPVDVINPRGRERRPMVQLPTIVARPSPMVSPRVWRYQLAFSLLTDGNAFGWIGDNVDGSGNPTRIDLMHATGITRRRVGTDGVPEVHVRDRGTHKLWPWGPVWHVPGKMVPAGSPFALSPLNYAGTAITAGTAAEGYGARYFTDGGHPSGLLSAEGEVDEPLARRIKESFLAAIGPGSREPAVMGSGITYHKVQADPNETQFIELVRFSIEQQCRYWRVPPSMVYAAVSGQNVTYANVSQADLHYLKHSVDGYLVAYEEAMGLVLVAPRQVKVNRDAFLRADPLERYKVHELALKTRTRTVNEVRELEDSLPFDGPEFDEPGVPPYSGGSGTGGMPAPVVQPPTTPQE